MRSGWPLLSAMEYTSTKRLHSTVCPGVSFGVRRLSLAGRLELAARLREAGERLAFHEAGKSVEDGARAAEIRARMETIYIAWGLASIEGLSIDGEPATPEALVERGPDELAREIAEAVRAELFLSPDERKN
jgi:hypothetical protein